MPQTDTADTLMDGVLGTLYGLALGDALGMPSQTLTQPQIIARYGKIAGFVTPFDEHPVSHGLIAGQVTDDTEQALLLAKRLIADGGGLVDDAAWAQDLLHWEADVRARGLRDLLGPSTKAALEAIAHGVPAGEASRKGTTNGAAMRIAPVGIIWPCSMPDRLVDAVAQTCRVTHNTGEAISGAAAVAASVSAGLDGCTADACLDIALDAAKRGQERGNAYGERDMSGRIRAAVDLADSGVSADVFAARIGTSVASYEAIPAAFGIARLAQWDVWQAGLLAANIGDDTDTIGAIACAMCGALRGMSGIPADQLETLRTVNDLDIEMTAPQLVRLRKMHTAQSLGVAQ